jgi:general secretion pathway protein A
VPRSGSGRFELHSPVPDDAATSMYESFFGLNDLPFRLTPDPKYLFMSAKHREAFAHLLYGVNEGSGFVAVTGEVGAGKTTLIRALLREADEKVVVIYIVNPVLTSTELLQTINSELGLPSDSTSRKELFEALSRFLHQTRDRGGRTVVIVDEAQNLDPVVLEQLRLLSNLETETDKLITIVLAGQPELRQLLERHDLRQLNQRVTVRWHLDTLEADETGDYVRHRLTVAGAQGELFEPKALALVHQYSGGVPRLINILCHRALLVGYARNRGRVGTAEVLEAARELGHGSGPVSVQSRRWLAPAVAAALVVAAVGVAWYSVRPFAPEQVRNPAADPAARAAAARVPAAVSAVTAPASPAAPVAPRDEAPPATLPVEEAPPPPPAPVVRPSAPAGTAVVDLRPQPAPGAVSDEAAIVARLGRGSVFDSATTGLADLLELWQAAGLESEDVASGTLDLQAVAEARGLEYLAAQMNTAFLGLLDLPAMLELRLPGEVDERYVLLRGMDASRQQWVLEDSLVVPRALAESWWNGRAHVLWRNVEHLPRQLGPGSGGPGVRNLQSLLREAGFYQGLGSGVYDETTEEAVRDFQVSRNVTVDGIAGPITQILLYNSIDRFARPGLVAPVRSDRQ